MTDTKRRVQAPRLGFAHAFFDRDSVCPELANPSTADARIRILHRCDDPGDASLDHALRARAGPTDVATWLEVDIQRAAARRVARVVERLHFRVRLAGACVPAVATDGTVRRDHDGADHRIGRGPPLSARRMKQRAPHHRDVE